MDPVDEARLNTEGANPTDDALLFGVPADDATRLKLEEAARTNVPEAEGALPTGCKAPAGDSPLRTAE